MTNFIKTYWYVGWQKQTATVVGVNLCVGSPLELKDKGMNGVGWLAGKEAYADHTINIIIQRQYFLFPCLIFCDDNVYG